MPVGELWMVAVGYLLGSIPFSYLVVKLLVGEDVRSQGSRSAGATNVSRVAGTWAGLATVLLDGAKGAAAVALAAAMTTEPALQGAAGTAAVAGHIWPLFLGFRGGKGAATAGGVMVVLSPLLTLLAVALLVGVIVWKRYVSLGTVTMAVATPLLTVLAQRLGWVSTHGVWLPASVTAMAVLILFAHRSNLHRLWNGVEPKLGQRHEELPRA